MQTHSDENAVLDWQAHVAALKHSNEDDGREPSSDMGWVRSTPPRFRVMAMLWLAEVSRHRKGAISSRGVAMVRALARADMEETIEHLTDGCSPEVLATWIAWYPVWIKSLTAELHRENPWLWLPAETVNANAAHKRALDKRTSKDEAQWAKQGAMLFSMVADADGKLPWRTRSLVQRIGGRSGPIPAERLWSMAKALISLDLCHFETDSEGKARCLVRTQD